MSAGSEDEVEVDAVEVELRTRVRTLREQSAAAVASRLTLQARVDALEQSVGDAVRVIEGGAG